MYDYLISNLDFFLIINPYYNLHKKIHINSSQSSSYLSRKFHFNHQISHKSQFTF